MIRICKDVDYSYADIKRDVTSYDYLVRDFTCFYSVFDFPNGEPYVQIIDDDIKNKSFTMIWDFENKEEILIFDMLCHTLRKNGGILENLVMPYVPFSRQDRPNMVGECFSLKWFCGLLNRHHFKEVYITDPHSDVTSALINNVIVIKQQTMCPSVLQQEAHYIICPDAGAYKKISQHVKPNTLGTIMFNKTRDTSNGELIVSCSDNRLANIKDRTCIIFDDICEKGGTFIKIAEILKTHQPRCIKLFTTHGFFTAGLDVFDGLIDEIYTRKGRVK